MIWRWCILISYKHDLAAYGSIAGGQVIEQKSARGLAFGGNRDPCEPSEGFYLRAVRASDPHPQPQPTR